MNRSLRVLGLLFSIFGMPACSTLAIKSSNSNPIVGAWFVTDTDAPFPYHMYVFNADGTMQQANPDAGDPHASDSDGKGISVKDGERIKGKWMEVIADRTTHKFIGRAEISYDIGVRGDMFAGTSTARSYDASGTLTDGPAAPDPFEGKRVTLP